MDEPKVSRKVVVVVDDEPTITTLLKASLEIERFTVVVFHNGESALDYIRSHASEIWRISLDQVLNGALTGDDIAAECLKLKLRFYRFVGSKQELKYVGDGQFVKPLAPDLVDAMVEARNAETPIADGES